MVLGYSRKCDRRIQSADKIIKLSITQNMFILQFIEELQNVRESEARFKQQYADAQRRERMLIRRLAAKEQEMQDYAVIYYSIHW